jgi:hypothetical protein
MSSARTRIAEALAAKIRELALDGIGSERVYVRQGRRAGATQDYPCCEVRRGPPADAAAGSGFRLNLPVYVFRLLFKLRDPLGPDTDFDRIDGWMDAVDAAFEGQELAGVGEVYLLRVRPLPPVEEARGDEYQLAVAGATVLAHCHDLTPARS